MVLTQCRLALQNRPFQRPKRPVSASKTRHFRSQDGPSRNTLDAKALRNAPHSAPVKLKVLTGKRPRFRLKPRQPAPRIPHREGASTKRRPAESQLLALCTRTIKFKHKTFCRILNYHYFCIGAVSPLYGWLGYLLVKDVYGRFLPLFKSRKFATSWKIRQRERLRWVYYNLSGGKMPSGN